MDNGNNHNKIVPPHLNADAYKSATTENHCGSYLDYIRIHSDGNVLIGSSELTGRYWDGGATIFKDIAEAKETHEQNKRTVYLTSGTADGCFVDNSKVLVCEDSGAVSLWTTSEEYQAWSMWREERSVAEHDAAALAVDCLSPESKYVTVGADGNAKVWDINEMICLKNYEAHTMHAVGVSVRPKSTTSFATCSYDEHVSLWDENIEKPALEIIYKNDCGVNCIQWLDENRLIFGDEAGVLRLIDIRNLQSLFKLTEFPAAIHKLAINAESDKVAVSCDNMITSVCEITEDTKCKVIYHDRHMHSNFVRGLAWDPKQRNLLHTVGWDGAINTHTI